ncbi:hypothetical protein M3196_00330 [Fictibacillus nanhaiensis]|uniref:hypothetical protein n=1 Tax=Fictibacillus nanhaiensis TaxID=742169 RepID=UPI0020407F42|nr:hypothetical protein [Fictibacillus nanhaiensis]MCM3730114.1 hypothetical protein [Fictibacillus nanhaiensis]
MPTDRKKPMIPRQKFVGHLLVYTIGTKELLDRWLSTEDVAKRFKTTKREVIKNYQLYKEVINKKDIYYDENKGEFYYISFGGMICSLN